MFVLDRCNYPLSCSRCFVTYVMLNTHFCLLHSAFPQWWWNVILQSEWAASTAAEHLLLLQILLLRHHLRTHWMVRRLRFFRSLIGSGSSCVLSLLLNCLLWSIYAIRGCNSGCYCLQIHISITHCDIGVFGGLVRDNNNIDRWYTVSLTLTGTLRE